MKRTDRIADTSVPLRLLSGTAPTAVVILHRLGGKGFHRITDTICSSFFYVCAECQVGGEFQPFVDLGVTVRLKIETAIIDTLHNTGLIEKTAGYIIMRLFRAAGIADRITLLHSRAQHLVEPVGSFSQ